MCDRNVVLMQEVWESEEEEWQVVVDSAVAASSEVYFFDHCGLGICL